MRKLPRVIWQARNVGGFSLIEMLVALVILVMALTAIYEVFSAGVRTAGTTEEYTRAVLIAQSRLAAAGVEKTARLDSTRGETNGFRWRTSFTPYHPDQENSQSWGRFEVQVDVAWGVGKTQRSIRLMTIKLLPIQ